jgi:hypothetical protein
MSPCGLADGFDGLAVPARFDLDLHAPVARRALFRDSIDERRDGFLNADRNSSLDRSCAGTSNSHSGLPASRASRSQAAISSDAFAIW